MTDVSRLTDPKREIVGDGIKRPSCSCCKVDIPVDTDEQSHMVILERGWFPVDVKTGSIAEDDRSEEKYIKSSVHLCLKCYYEDPNLCAFFKRVGWTTR